MIAIRLSATEMNLSVIEARLSATKICLTEIVASLSVIDEPVNDSRRFIYVSEHNLSTTVDDLRIIKRYPATVKCVL
jgi:hypothetical protein